MNTNKSIVDKVPVVSPSWTQTRISDSPFGSSTKAIDLEGLQKSETVIESPTYPPEKTFTALGSCPTCGAPVYGPLSIMRGESAPPAVYTCQCRTRVEFSSIMQTK